MTTLYQEIQAKCTPQEIASRDCHLIAQKVSLNRTTLRKGLEVTTRGAAARFPAIPPLNSSALSLEFAIDKLETYVAANLGSAVIADRMLAKAINRQLTAFQTQGLDFAENELRMLLDLLATRGVISQEEADGFKSLAPTDVAPVSWSDVVHALDTSGV